MKYFIEKLESVPTRYTLHPEVTPIRFSLKTLKNFRLQEGDEVEESLIEELVTYEKENLFNNALIYLSKSEKSPQKFSNWLSLRGASDEWIAEFTERVTEADLLNPKRYCENKVEALQQIGNKPKWRILRELKNEGVSEDILASVTFDDKIALKNRIKDDRSLKKLLTEDKQKLIRRLQAKGFKLSDILATLNSLDKG